MIATEPSASPALTRTSTTRRWRLSSLLLILVPWLVLQLGGLFSPGLLDDVDSVYTEIAREMLVRHDFVTPTVDGIRFFDKPPLMYWMAAGSMRLFGVHDWAARLPLAVGFLALLIALYALGLRLFASVSPADAPDRGGLYAALATAVSIGPYLYTRFYIPDVLVGLWLTLAVHCLLIALERIRQGRSAALPSAGFAAVTALNLLTKGFIGLVFPLGFALAYLLWTGQWRLWRKLNLALSTAVFLAIAAPWHILAALRNPPVPMPPGLGLPAHAGWSWFYLYNEHIARFLQRRIPHDYGQVPVPLFWALLLLWLIPWTAFLPAAVLDAIRDLRAARRADQPTSPHLAQADPLLARKVGSRSGAPHLGRAHPRLLHPLRTAGVLPPARPARTGPARRRSARRRRSPPPRRTRTGPQPSRQTSPHRLPLVPRPTRRPALRRLWLLRDHRASPASRRHPQRSPKLQP